MPERIVACFDRPERGITMESGSYSVESHSGLRLLRSGERSLDSGARGIAPVLCFAVTDTRAGALEVRAWGERIVFVLRPRGRVSEVREDGILVDDGIEPVSVRWSLPREIRLPSLLGRRVRIEHRVEMAGGAAASESLIVIDAMDGNVLLAAHEGSIDRAPSVFAVEVVAGVLTPSSLERRKTHDLVVLSLGRRRCAFVATPKLP
ncbi:MAG: hypothetical protein IT379_33605 [Deltaproteobacteria bacterium]|nr:hypothetical protein [Deltaproteobacteria bacterium]